MEFGLEKEPSQVEPTCYVEVEESSSTEDSKEEMELAKKLLQVEVWKNQLYIDQVESARGKIY